MPVDKKIHLRLQLLDHLLRMPDGITYRMIQESYGKEGFKVSIRTIQKDIDVLCKDYLADMQITRCGHQVRVRYKDTTKSVFSHTSTASFIEVVKSRLEKEIFNPHFLIAASILEHLAEGNPVQQYVDAVDFGYNEDLSGIEYFPFLLRAIINRQCVSFTYHPFGRPAVDVTVSPYLLRLYNQRWFLICKTTVDGPYFIDALDRIEGEVLIADNSPFIYPDYEYIRKCLDYTIGTNNAFNEDVPVDSISLRVSTEYYPYLETKPFIDQEASLDGDSYIVSFRAKVNKELVNRILALGTEAEVLAPEDLRKIISLKISELSIRYQETTK